MYDAIYIDIHFNESTGYFSAIFTYVVYPYSFKMEEVDQEPMLFCISI